MTGWRLYIFLIIAGFIWFFRWFSGLNLDLQSGQQVQISGIVLAQPSIKTDQHSGDSYQWVWLESGSEIFGFKTDQWTNINYHDHLSVTGEISQLNQSTISSRRWIISNPEIKHHSISQLSGINKYRDEILSLFRTTLPGDEAGLLSGMVLGTKGELSDDFYSYLQNSGTLHVVVASGFNIMLIAGTVTSVAIVWFKRQIAVVLSIIFIWLYVWLAGFEAPVIRAGIMGSLVYFGIITGRVRDTGWLLVITSILMLWWRPTWIWDAGFQLSVAATAGLIWIEPVFKDWIDNKTINSQPFKFSKIRSYIILLKKIFIKIISIPVVGESLRTTLAAQIGVIPILLITFNQISLLSPIVNTLVLWVVPVITSSGIMIGMLSLFTPTALLHIHVLLLWIIWPLLKYFTLITSWFGRIEVIQIQVSWWFSLLWYGLLIILLNRKNKIYKS